MKFPSRKSQLFPGLRWGLLAVALAALAAVPVAAQYQQAPYQGQYPNQGYAQPQYDSPQYAQPQPYGDQQGYASQQLSYAPQSAAQPMMTQEAMAPEQIEQLLAPIALYPDALVAQILAGATYPAQIAAADQWVHQMGMVGPDQMAAAASAQTMWDPSIKALTAYPQVLDVLAGNLQWTTTLGNAYYNQPQDVLQTVQVMRMRAQQAGALVNTPQMQVMQNAGYISLAPPTEDTMYVPTYNPWTSYGDPVQPYPGFSFTGILSTLANTFLGGGFGGGRFGNGVGSGALQFLSSFALGAFNHTPFGLISWGLDWLFNALTFHHNDYYTASRSVSDWGLPRGGPRYRGFARASYDGNRFREGFGNGYNHEAIAVHGGSRFGGNTFRGGVRPVFGNGNARPEYQHQMAFDHGQQTAFRNDYNGGRGNYNSGFTGRTISGRTMEPRMGMTQPARPENYRGSMGAMQPSRQTYQSPMSNAVRGSMGNSMGSYSGNTQRGAMAYNGAYGGAQNFHQDRSGFDRGGSERSGGFFGGGGSYKQPKFSEPKFKEPKMPKMQSFKAPKEHFSGGGHSGGGHSSGGHGGGGHHR